MTEALIQAKKAENHGDVPVGAVIVFNGEIIAKGQNKREKDKNSLLQAEICAIDEACRHLGRTNLAGCTLYVTLEPCPMCAGAIINSRIDKVVFGAYDDKAGCFGTLTDFTALPFNHKPEIIGGYMEKECADVLRNFFEKLREG
jgi:tRNA(adenine34) deaminase